MKKNFVFAAIFSLFVCAVAVSAQDKSARPANFSGTWTLDVAKSKLGDRNMIESQTLAVVQTDKDIKITQTTKRMAPPAGGGGGRMGGGMGGGDMTTTYTLDGKETTVEMDSPMGGKIPVKYTGKLDGGKLWLGSSRTMNTQAGERTMTSKETWWLSPDGNTLTIDGESTNPRGTNSTQKVFTKKP